MITYTTPCVNEIAYDVDDDPHAYYIQQAQNGLLPEAKALSAVLLYRFATMLLPCAIGAFFVLGERIISLHRKKRTAD